MGEARRRRLAEQAQAQANGIDASDKVGSELPRTHFEVIRERNKNLFRFLAHDLARLQRERLDVPDILPPRGECAEDDYLDAFLEHVSTRPHRYPHLQSRASAELTVQQMLREYRALLAFLHGGSKQFFFTEGLTEALCCTQLNAPCDQLKLPYPGFLMVYDSPAALEALSAFTKQPVVAGTVITMYVREDELEEVGCRRLLLTGFVMKGEQNLMGFSRQLALRSDWTLEQALHTDWDKLDVKLEVPRATAASTNDAGEYEPESLAVEAFFNEGLQFVRMLVNSILYITSRDAELAERLCPRKVAPVSRPDAPQLAPVPQAWTLVGEHVESVPIVIDPARKHEPGTPLQREGLRYKVRFTVAGFWRRPPNSPPDAKKDVWVRPHARGPEMADLVNRPYVVR